MNLDWKLISEEARPAGFRKLVRRRFELPDGRQDDFDLYADGDVATTVALTADEQVIMVRHFRPGPLKILDELIGGFIDHDEDPLEAAKREMREEIGYDGQFEQIGQSYFGAYSTGKKYIFLAQNCHQVADHQREVNEQMEIVQHTLDEYKQNVLAGLTTDMDAGLLALHHLGKL